MIIQSFSVKNFRSIKKTNELPFHDISILIGPNNEGKSNILIALVRTLKILSNATNSSLRYDSRENKIFIRKSFSFEKEKINYDWARDFPLELQKNNSKENTEFVINFSLNEKEIKLLKEPLGNKFTGNVMATLIFKREYSFSVLLKIIDPVSKKSFNFDAIRIITLFLSKNLSVQYINTIRTTDTATEVVNSLISNEMSLLEGKKEYTKLLKRFEKLRQPIYKKLSQSLTKNVSNFLPNVKKILVTERETLKKIIRESSKIVVLDKVETDLELKGDGIKSLVAISIIQYATNKNSSSKNLILAIEEPESHLHPEAIHRLKEVLNKISKKHQVIITTHSPILVSRSTLKKNLIVNNSKVSPAKNISEVRELLGVHVSDNLISANLVILTEGENDITILKKILTLKSTKIKLAIKKGTLVFDHLVGGANLKYKICQYKNLMCDIYSFLDNDESGRKSYKEARDNDLISDKEITFASLRSYKNSEIEDLIDPFLYKKLVFNNFGVNLEGKIFKNNKKKWSDRVRDTFIGQGKPWDENVEKNIKKIVSEAIEKKQKLNIKREFSSCLKPMIIYIEKYLDSDI